MQIIQDKNRLYGLTVFVILTVCVAGFSYFNSEPGSDTKDVNITLVELPGNGTEKNPYLVSNLTSLNSVRLNKNSTYKITKDINAKKTLYINKGRGFRPIGVKNLNKPFTGQIYGNNKTIYNLSIIRPNSKFVGLIGLARNANIRNLSLKSAYVEGLYATGLLVGGAKGKGNLSNVRVSGNVKGGDRVGGLIGESALKGNILESSSNSNVSGRRFVGGLVGYNHVLSKVSDSNSKSYVKAKEFSSGGLVGRNMGLITDSTSDSRVVGGDRVGGLVGENLGKSKIDFDPTINNSVSYSDVDGERFIGLFVGFNGLDVHNMNRIENKSYEVIIENSSYVSEEGKYPIGRNKGDKVELRPIDR